jgi:predicted nucleic acid-binding protein
MRALVDTNVILDVLLNREAFLPASADVWIANEQKLFEGFVSAITPVNVYYVARSSKRNKATARSLAATVLDAFQVCPLGITELRSAVATRVSDYEDAVQVVQSLAAQVDFIVTRDVKDFANSPIRAITPAEFVKELQ